MFYLIYPRFMYITCFDISSKEHMASEQDGNISLVSLLRWYNKHTHQVVPSMFDSGTGWYLRSPHLQTTIWFWCWNCHPRYSQCEFSVITKPGRFSYHHHHHHHPHFLTSQIHPKIHGKQKNWRLPTFLGAVVCSSRRFAGSPATPSAPPRCSPACWAVAWWAAMPGCRQRANFLSL